MNGKQLIFERILEMFLNDEITLEDVEKSPEYLKKIDLNEQAIHAKIVNEIYSKMAKYKSVEVREVNQIDNSIYQVNFEIIDPTAFSSDVFSIEDDLQATGAMYHITINFSFTGKGSVKVY